jgi:hypothetical protein
MSHVQHVDSEGVNLPSVSEIPSIFAKNMGGFEDWICRKIGPHTCCTQAKRKFYQEAADLGNDIHALREAFLKGESFSEGVPEYQAKVFEPIAQFYRLNDYHPLQIDSENGIELKMTGKEFGGTLDGVGTFTKPFWEKQRRTFWDDTSLKYLHKDEFPGECLPTTDSLWIEDLKIKSKLDPLHPLQLYGYALLLKEVYGIEVNWGLIIRREKNLDKKPEIQLKGYYLPAYKDIWDHAFACWRFLND